MTSDSAIGQCLCGNVKIRVRGMPDFSVLCFCKDCQRISGGGHLPQAAFSENRVEISGSTETFQWQSDAGNALTLTFCPDCGSPLCKTTSKMPNMVFMAVGLLDDQSQFVEPHHAFVESCQHWDRMREEPAP